MPAARDQAAANPARTPIDGAHPAPQRARLGTTRRRSRIRDGPEAYGRTIEIGHIVSLELGGSNDIANLFPEPGSGPANYHVKDKLENKLSATPRTAEPTSGQAPMIDNSHAAVSGAQPGTQIASAVSTASFGFGKLMAVLAALGSIGAGIYLLTFHSVVNLGNGTVSWFQIIAHGRDLLHRQRVVHGCLPVRAS